MGRSSYYFEMGRIRAVKLASQVATVARDSRSRLVRSRVAPSLENKTIAHIEDLIRDKIDNGTLKTEDLCDSRVLAAAERYLQQLYPGLDLRQNPANELLNGKKAVETQKAISHLILSADMERVSVQALEDPKALADFEQNLSRLYPDLDLSIDPSTELLEGKLKVEVERVIDELADC